MRLFPDKPTALFLGIAFGGGWAAQLVVVVLTRAAVGPAELRTLLPLVAAPFLMWPPAIGAFAARRYARTQGLTVPELGLRWQRGLGRWLWAGWALPVGAALVTAVLSLPLNPLDTELGVLRRAFEAAGQTPPLSLEWMAVLQLLAGLTLAPVVNVVFAAGEEIGWRGDLAPACVSRWGPRAGLWAHGAVWGIWHAPLIALGGHNYPNHPYLGVALFTLFCGAFGAILAWLRFRSGSVWPAALGHATLNAVGGFPAFLLKDVEFAVSGVLWSALGIGVTGALAVSLTSRFAGPER